MQKLARASVDGASTSQLRAKKPIGALKGRRLRNYRELLRIIRIIMNYLGLLRLFLITRDYCGLLRIAKDY